MSLSARRSGRSEASSSRLRSSSSPPEGGGVTLAIASFPSPAGMLGRSAPSQSRGGRMSGCGGALGWLLEQNGGECRKERRVFDAEWFALREAGGAHLLADLDGDHRAAARCSRRA